MDDSLKRTEHSKLRREEGKPAGPAYYDAQQVRQSKVYIQPNDYWVVRGPQSREHVFASNGDLITSLIRSKATHELKVKRNERRRITGSEFEKFKRIFQ